MNDLEVGVATMAAALCCAVVAGAFLAFSTFVMHALGRLPAVDGIAAMQAINVSAVRPVFMTTLFGTAAVGVVAVATTWGGAGTGLRVAAAAWYLLGTIGITIIGNVPLNNGLAALHPTADEAAVLWQHYLVAWTNWNHLRTMAALVAAVLFATASTVGA